MGEPKKMQTKSQNVDLRGDEIQMRAVRKGYSMRDYAGAIVVLLVIPLSLTMIYQLALLSVHEFVAFYNGIVASYEVTHLLIVLLCGFLMIALGVLLFLRQPHNVYITGFHTFKGDSDWNFPRKTIMARSVRLGVFTDESIKFQERLHASSAIGDKALYPKIFFEPHREPDMKAARYEAEEVMFKCVEEALKNAGLKPKQIDVLVVNCSLFCPTPSLSSMIIHHFKMRTGILSYNLGGMGCSAGVISIDLAKRVLQNLPNSRALVLSTENITLNWYTGNEKGMLLQNCLFRVGGAAIILSNRRSDRSKALFKLKHCVRTHKGSDQGSYESVYQEEDHEGNIGVRLSKSIMKVAAEALKDNITTLGPLTLPMTEQIKFFVNLCARTVLRERIPANVPQFFRDALYTLASLTLYPSDSKLTKFMRRAAMLPECTDALKHPTEIAGKPYIPNFKKAFQHFCVHAGGRKVLEAIEINLQLERSDLEASFRTLWKHGNTSSSSIWYELEHHIKYSGVKKGDAVWQIAFGSGFKCNSAVWEAMRSFEPQPKDFDEDMKNIEI